MAETAKPKLVTYDGLAYLVDGLKAKFVLQEAGKGLSANDFTDALKAKLDSVSVDGYDVATTEDLDAMLDNVFGNGEGEVSGGGEGAQEGDEF